MEKEIIDGFLNKTLEYLNSAEAFLQKNVPAFVEELLLFEFYSSLVLVLFFLGLLGISFFLRKKTFTYCETNRKDLCDSDDAFLKGMSVTIVVILSIVNVIILPIQVMDMVKVKVAPRVYLVEKVSDMVKK